MTLDEAAQSGISRVRNRLWANPNAYARIDIVRGGRGPWLHLYDRTSQELIGAPTPQSDLSIGDTSDNWHEYKGEIDPADIGPA